jgi:hypothetical protein
MYSYCYVYVLALFVCLFCLFCFHRANSHSPATLTEVFLCFFLSCKAKLGYNSQSRGTARTLPT